MEKYVLLQVRENWIEEVSGGGVIRYRDEQTGATQMHPPEGWNALHRIRLESIGSVPSFDNLVSSRRPHSDDSGSSETSLQSSSQSQKEISLKNEALRRQSKSMTSDYMSDLDKYNMAKPYSRRADKSFDPNALCAVCKMNKCSMVFFPCEHKCTCNKCLGYLPPPNSVPSKGVPWPHACPICFQDVVVMFENTGEEVESYWKWGGDMTPPLSSKFITTFKRAGSRLNTTPTMVFPTLEELGGPVDENEAEDDVDEAVPKHTDPPRILKDRAKTCLLM